MRIEISRPKKSDQKPDAPTLTPEEIQALEIEKAQLLATLSPQRKRVAKASEPAPEAPASEPVRESAATDPEPVLEVAALAIEDATMARKALEQQLAALTRDLAAAQQRERDAKLAAAAAARSRSQADGKRVLSVFEPKLRHHLAEVGRVQARYGPVLRDFARSCASDQDSQVRRKVSEVNAAAGPLAMKINDARLTIEAALRGLTQAMGDHAEHVHAQAQVLAEAALGINIITLETECRTLVNLKKELRGGHLEIRSVTNDLIKPPSWSDPSALPDTAQF